MGLRLYASDLHLSTEFRSEEHNSTDAATETMVKRETIGERIQRARTETGMSREDVAIKADKIARRIGAKVSESMVRDLEGNRFPNPGFKSVGSVALALDIPPLELLGLGFEEEHVKRTAKLESAFERTRFGRLWKAYNKAESPRLRALVEDTVQMLIDRLSKG